MSYAPQTPSSYGAFQSTYSSYGGQSQEPYTPLYSPQVPSTSYAFNDYQQQPPRLPSPPALDLPDFSSVDAAVASQSLQRLISAQLRLEGFSSCESNAMRRLELEVITLVTRLYERAHEYGNLANRAGPIPTDLLQVCYENGLSNKDLRKTALGRPKLRRRSSAPLLGVPQMKLIPAETRSTSPKLLPAEDANATLTMPTTIRTLPQPLPALPPRHTYLRTPIDPPKKTALPSLEKKLKTASLVQGSLKNLLLATEDMTGQEDGELLGHIVNHEVTVHPRKRWKLGN